MKKIININLSGRVIPIEDSAYESLQRYIESLRRYFSSEEGRDEIINDIESRIAELMNEKVRKGAPAITDQDMLEIINSMGRVEDFEAADAEAKTTQASEKTSGAYTQSQTESQSFTRRPKGRLYRDASDKLLGGVCSGIANYMNVDPAIVRLLFAIITFGGFGTGILIYIILWIILPIRDLDVYVGKRLFRNPDDRVISGVAGGLGAYFNKPSWIFRLVLALPILLNILFGVFSEILFHGREFYPNIFIGSFSGTFLLAYIILWIVLPEARSPYEKMEMRGEKVDVNRIRQNVQEGMGNVKNRMESWGEEVKTSAERLGQRAKEFANTRGKAFAGEVAETARPVGRGCGHVIGVLFKAFFIFVFGCIALALFAALMAILLGGVAWWPINNFLWTSSLQKVTAWGTLIFFIGIPIIAFMTWLVRRIARVRSRNRYLGWIFGGLWTIGWVSAITFAISIAKDLREYERTSEGPLTIAPPNGRLIVRVNEPEIRYSGTVWFIREDNTGWDITDDTMKYDNVKIRYIKSKDSLYHVTIYKYSFGRNVSDAQARASRIKFNTSVEDSILNIGSGLSIDHNSKFRGQGILMEIQIPVGKQISFDRSLIHAFNPWIIRRNNDNYWSRRYGYHTDLEDGDYFDWDPDVWYTMDSTGKLIDPNAPKKSERQEEYDDTQDQGPTDATTPVPVDSLERKRIEQKRAIDSMNKEFKNTEQKIKEKRTGKRDDTDELPMAQIPIIPTFI
ncbi:MAG: PspC domain-containing protein [Flavisolibacter sp.]